MMLGIVRPTRHRSAVRVSRGLPARTNGSQTGMDGPGRAPAKADLAVDERDQPAVGDGDAVRVAAEIG